MTVSEIITDLLLTPFGFESDKVEFAKRVAERYAQANSKWNTIDSAPKDGKPVLVTIAGKADYYPVAAYWSEEHEQWIKHVTSTGVRIYLPIKPTHWMYLPDSPE